MTKSKTKTIKNPNLMVCLLYSEDHQNLKRMANLIANSGEEYFKIKSISFSSKNYILYLKRSFEIILYLLKNKVDFIILVEPWYPIVFYLILKHNKSKMIYWSGNINYDVLKTLGYGRLLITIIKITEITIIKRSNLIIADSEALTKFFSNYNSTANIYYIPENLEDEEIKHENEDIMDMRIIQGQTKVFNIVYLSSIHLVAINHRMLPRGWELIEVCKTMIESGMKNFNFTIIGGGKGLDDLKKLISIYHLEDYFIVTGFVSDTKKEELMKKMDVGFCEDYKSFLTHKYNLSSKIQEYLRYGIPVITGKQGDKREVICSGERTCGVCIEPLDDKQGNDYVRYINDIRNSILSLKLDVKELEEMKKNCRLEYSQRFSKTAIKKKFEEVFRFITT